MFGDDAAGRDRRHGTLSRQRSAVQLRRAGAAGAGVGGQGGAGYYERLLRKKHKHVARVALARKLLIAVYALLHDGVVFEEEKFAAV